MSTMIFSVSVLVSGVFVGLIAWVAYWQSRAIGLLVLAAVGTIIGSMLASPLLVFQGLLTFVFAATCLLFRAKSRTIVITAVVAAALSISIMTVSVYSKLQTLDDLRDSHPYESLTDRLSYEDTYESTNALEVKRTLPANVETRLTEFEDRSGFGTRVWALEAVHSDTYRDFVAAQGFGVSRMGYVRAAHVELPSLDSIPLPTPRPLPYDPNQYPQAGPLAQRTFHEDDATDNDALMQFHTEGGTRFFEFGIVRLRERPPSGLRISIASIHADVAIGTG